LTRQKLPLIDRTKFGAVAGAGRGGYVLAEAPSGTPEVVIMASGSEVEIAMKAQVALVADGIQARVVSMPSHELFLKQDADYRASVLPSGAKRVAVEAAHPMSWQRFVDHNGAIVGIDTFGASAPFQKLYQEYGITAEHVAAAAKGVLGR
jgi:transketolase